MLQMEKNIVTIKQKRQKQRNIEKGIEVKMGDNKKL